MAGRHLDGYILFLGSKSSFFIYCKNAEFNFTFKQNFHSPLLQFTRVHMIDCEGKKKEKNFKNSSYPTLVSQKFQFLKCGMFSITL
jgi:hypothetical protein